MKTIKKNKFKVTTPHISYTTEKKLLSKNASIENGILFDKDFVLDLIKNLHYSCKMNQIEKFVFFYRNLQNYLNEFEKN